MEKPSAIPSNMVMIDQAQLMELLAAKQTLDAQRASEAKPGFNSALFISPPRMSKENKTQCTSNVSNTSVDYTGEIKPLRTIKQAGVVDNVKLVSIPQGENKMIL